MKIYRIMTEDGQFPNRSFRQYQVLFYDVEYAKRCEKAIRQFNKGVRLVIEESEVQWERT